MSNCRKRIQGAAYAAGALMLFLLLMLEPQASLTGAKKGLSLCAGTIIPSLFPLLTASSLMAAMGLPDRLGRLCAPMMSRLFSVSGLGAAPLVLGLTGGYPLGAAAAAQLYRGGSIDKAQAEQLLAFCNNSGPAFIVGAAGMGVFGSTGAGFVLYAAHILAALLTGIVFSRRTGNAPVAMPETTAVKRQSPAAAFPDCVRASVTGTLYICGFVVFFSVFVSILTDIGMISALCGIIAQRLPISLTGASALLTGLLELGSGIGALSGVPVSPGALAAAAFILGWGGLSVHFQTLSVLEGLDLSTLKHTLGKLLHGLLSAGIAFVLALLFL